MATTISVHSLGVFSRRFADAIETADRPIGGVRYASASSGQIMYAVLPAVLPQWAAIVATNFSSTSRAALAHRFWQHDKEHIVYCFAEKLDADYFRVHFGGEPVTPETRPKRVGRRAPKRI